MLKILIVEDDDKISDSLATYLKNEFDILQVYDGEEGLYEIQTKMYDLVILDWMLPYKNGLDVLRQIRKENLSVPVLMLTAKDQIEDKMKGFETGVDDYLTKPFYLEELKMRIYALLKRAGKMSTSVQMQFGNLTIDESKHEVFVEGERVEILGKEFDLLIYLVQNKGAIVTKEQIFDRIWGFDSQTTITVVEVYMSKLRKHLKGSTFVSSLQTLRNVGYLLKKEDEV